MEVIFGKTIGNFFYGRKKMASKKPLKNLRGSFWLLTEITIGL